jgi:hypothetical protein
MSTNSPLLAYQLWIKSTFHEELKVLHWRRLVNTRDVIFPDKDPYPDEALDSAQGEGSVIMKHLEQVQTSTVPESIQVAQDVNDERAPAKRKSSRKSKSRQDSLHEITRF